MLELPLVSPGFIQEVVLNFTIIATLLLLYSFIPDRFLKQDSLAFPLSVGVVFGIAGVLSIPALWMTSDAPTLGFNIILIPLAGFIAGPVSAAFVVVALFLGNTASNGTISSLEILTLTSSILLGALVYQGKSWSWFPRSYTTRLVILGAGVVMIEIGSSLLQFVFLDGPGGGPPRSLPFSAMLPFFLFSFIVTIALGGITGFIDRKKQAEQELREYRDHLKSLVKERTAELRVANSLQKATIEATADAIVVTDRDNRIRAYNLKAAQVLGLPDHIPAETTENWTFSEHVAASLTDPGSFISLFRSLPDSAEQIVTTDLQFASGRIFELFVKPQRIGDRIAGRVWSLHDITERRRAEDAIRAANNKLLLLSDLTRHDILNQLTALGGFVEMLREQDGGTRASSHFDTIEKILEVIRLQIEFTRDYQNLGIQKPTWEQVGAGFLRAAESFAGTTIDFRCETGELEIYTDPMIERVFHNFIDNSIRHGGHVTKVRLTCAAAEPDLLLVYEDNGTGVLPAEKEKIFLKGFGKHTGLGMFLIREILSITGMTIRETGTYGRGARFEIRIPSGNYRYGTGT